jgi:hypothetical protein
MSAWITERLPTKADGTEWLSLVWLSSVDGSYTAHWSEVKLGQPWQPITKPAPYVKPKRWTVEWNDQLGFWMLMDMMSRLNTGLNWLQLPSLTHQHGKTAEQIEDLFNETLP